LKKVDFFLPAGAGLITRIVMPTASAISKSTSKQQMIAAKLHNKYLLI
jgi:hypothetical protein